MMNNYFLQIYENFVNLTNQRKNERIYGLLLKMFKNNTLNKIMCYIPGTTVATGVSYTEYENAIKVEIAKRNLQPETVKKISAELARLERKSTVTGNVQFMDTDLEFHYLFGSLFKSGVFGMLYWFNSPMLFHEITTIVTFELVYVHAAAYYLDAVNKQHKKIMSLLNSEEIYGRISQ